MMGTDSCGPLEEARGGWCRNGFVVEQCVVAVDDVVVVAQSGRTTERRHRHLLRFGGR